MRLLVLAAAWALNAVTLLARLGTDLGTHALDYATLGVFCRFQIPDFNLFFGFFSLCHFIFPSIYLYLGLFWANRRLLYPSGVLIKS